jgi:hypothetical protein
LLSWNPLPVDTHPRRLHPLRVSVDHLRATIICPFVADVVCVRGCVEFPQEMDLFLQVLQTVEDCNKTRLMLMADVAESSNVIKAMVIRAEDARIQGKTQQVGLCSRSLPGWSDA